MFLDVTTRRNPRLVQVAKDFHQSGKILPDTYLLDLDTIESNTRILSQKAKESGIDLFYMTKQLGRNPLVSQRIYENGIKKAVVVDFKEALLLMEQGLPLGNVGHLVQIPYLLLKKIMSYGSEYITVYSLDIIKEISLIALELKIEQKILIKMIDKDDQIYEGQLGGFYLSQIPELVSFLSTLSNVSLAGLTSFPCFLFDGSFEFKPTHNTETLNKAKEILKQFGFLSLEMNIPSATCSLTIPIIKGMGGTQGEPGHALTGTTPLHAKLDLEELPAIVYISEISHSFNGHSYFYGGGYYRRSHWESVLIFEKEKVKKDIVMPFGSDSIDYYLSTKEEHKRGATVLASFRTQIFVTRSEVAVVSGIQKGLPKIEGIYTSHGKLNEGGF